MTEGGRRVRKSIISDVEPKMDLAVVSAGISFFVILLSFVLTFSSLWLGFLLTVLLTMAVFISVYIDESNIAVGFVVYVLVALLGWFVHWQAWIIMAVATTVFFAMSLIEQLIYSSRG